MKVFVLYFDFILVGFAATQWLEIYGRIRLLMVIHHKDLLLNWDVITQNREKHGKVILIFLVSFCLNCFVRKIMSKI